MQINKDDFIANFSDASALERTVLMCMERIAELERRADIAEERDAALKERKVIMKKIMNAGSKYNTILVDVMAYLIGPQWNPEEMHIKQDGDTHNSERVTELCTIAKRGMKKQDCGVEDGVGFKWFWWLWHARCDDYGGVERLFKILYTSLNIVALPPVFASRRRVACRWI